MSKNFQELLRLCATLQQDFVALDQASEATKAEPYAYNEMSPRMRNLADLLEKVVKTTSEEMTAFAQGFQEAMAELKSMMDAGSPSEEELQAAMAAQMQPVYEAIEQTKSFLAVIPVRFSMLQTLVAPEHQEGSLPLVSELTEECGNIFASLSVAAGSSYEEAINAFAQETMLQTGLSEDQQSQFFSEVGDGAQG